MVKKILLLIIVVYCNTLFAQREFAPAGAEWCYRFVNPAGEVESYYGLTYVKDTLVPPWNAKLLRGKSTAVNGAIAPTTFSENLLYFERNDSIYFIYGTESPEFSLFNKRYEVGDTILSYIFDAYFVVQEVDATSLNQHGIQIAIAQSEFLPELDLKIYDYIGPNFGFSQGWWTTPLGDNELELIAYRDNTIGSIKIKDEGCFGFIDAEPPVTATTPDTCTIEIFPNPISSILKIHLPCNNVKTRTFDLTIYDARDMNYR